MKKHPQILVSCVSTLPESVVQLFINELTDPRIHIEVERREETAFAGMEWYIPTAAVIYVTRPYFEGFLREAGKDHYHALKKGVAALWPVFFGKDRLIRMRLTASSSGKASSEPQYSLGLSLMAEGGAGGNFKLLLPDMGTQEELEEAVFCFQKFLANFYRGEVDEFMKLQLKTAKPIGRVILLTYNKESENFYVVYPRSSKTKIAAE